MDPGVIKKLEEAVVNRIAAGEIIQRPSNAVKELLENSLDAKSTSIQVTVKSGGLKLLQILDNGTGIRKEDMEIVCHRFTTSKLVNFEDLSNIATFGFRGEALASISHVAHLTIQTKTRKEQSAYKSSYVDGKLTGPLTHCAGTQGTIITIEDLFYNMPQRKQALKSPTEEFQKIADVVMKYAVHNAKVGFTLKKMGQSPFIRTMPKSMQKDNIKALYGSQIAEQLMDVELNDDLHKFLMKALITKVSYSAKRLTLLLFINNRLVDSAALKVAIDAVYSPFLPKGSHPFVYMSLLLEPSNVDVNVHPTKHEVHFLNETDIIEKIKAAFEARLLSSDTTKKIYQQLKLPGASKSPEKPVNDAKNTSVSETTRPSNMVRTDAKDQKLERFLISSHTTAKLNPNATLTGDPESSFRQEMAKSSSDVKLSSVIQMRRRVEHAYSSELKNTLKSMVFIGVVDRTFSLFQFGVKMYLCNTVKFCEELFYQRLVYEFQAFNEISFNPALSIKDLMGIALETIGWNEETDGDRNDIAQRATSTLVDRSALLQEYFSLKITEEGTLESIPLLLENHVPSIACLPMYLLRLSTKVCWDTEEECFETFCRETAGFYSKASHADAKTAEHKWRVEHVICPAFKKYLLPNNQLKSHLYELTNLPTLYKVFERC